MIGFLTRLLDTNAAAIYDYESARQVFTGASIMRITAIEQTRTTQYQVESGASRTDGHRIVMPDEVTVDFIISRDIKNVYAEFRRAKTEGTLFSIQSRAATIDKCIITEMPREESASSIGAVGLQVRFQRWQEITPEFGEMPVRQVANPQHSDTAQSGSSSGREVPEDKKQSLLAKWFGDMI